MADISPLRQLVAPLFSDDQAALRAEAKRREALRHLSSNPAISAGDFTAACKVITQVAAETPDSARVGIGLIRQDKLVNQTACNLRSSDNFCAAAFGAGSGKLRHRAAYAFPPGCAC